MALYTFWELLHPWCSVLQNRNAIIFILLVDVDGSQSINKAVAGPGLRTAGEMADHVARERRRFLCLCSVCGVCQACRVLHDCKEDAMAFSARHPPLRRGGTFRLRVAESEPAV